MIVCGWEYYACCIYRVTVKLVVRAHITYIYIYVCIRIYVYVYIYIYIYVTYMQYIAVQKGIMHI